MENIQSIFQAAAPFLNIELLLEFKLKLGLHGMLAKA
jgi:hypothetical protein